MKELPAKIGFDEETGVLIIQFNPTFSDEGRDIIKKDAKVVFNARNGELDDVKIMMREPPEFLNYLGGEDPSHCSVCSSLSGLTQRFRNIQKAYTESGSTPASASVSVSSKSKFREKSRATQMALLALLEDEDGDDLL